MTLWPDAPQLSPEVREKLNTRLAKFLEEDSSPDGAKDGHAVQDLVLDLFAIFAEVAGTGTEEARQFSMILTGIEWDTDEPRFAHAQKYLNRLFAGRLADAYAYIEKAHSQRAGEDEATAKKAMEQKAAQGGKAKHREHKAAKQRALAFYRDNHAQFRDKKEAAFYCAERFPPVAMSTYYRILRKM